MSSIIERCLHLRGHIWDIAKCYGDVLIPGVSFKRSSTSTKQQMLTSLRSVQQSNELLVLPLLVVVKLGLGGGGGGGEGRRESSNRDSFRRDTTIGRARSAYKYI